MMNSFTGATYLPAQPPKEASPAKHSSPTLGEPLTNGMNPSPSDPPRDHRIPAAAAALVECRHHHDDLVRDHLPISLPSDEAALVKEFQAHVMPLVRPEWRPELLRHRVFEDGVTNKLMGFFQDAGKSPTTAADDDAAAVLVRVNGEGREFVVDGDTEILVMLTLHKAGLSPPLYLTTENALCYGYIPGRALTGSEMQREDVLEATSLALAKFHSIPPPSCLLGRTPWVWRQTETWMKLVSTSYQHKDKVSHRFKQVFGTVEDMILEMEWVKSFLRVQSTNRADKQCQVNGDGMIHSSSTTNGTTTGSCLEDTEKASHSLSVCVLCHNDPQPLNFVRTPTGGVVLIDMEYSDVNYAAFDIGAFFCEFAGVHGTLDYSRYPNEKFQKRWISSYLHKLAQIKGETPATVSEAEVDTLYRDANNFALVAHFLWSLWSLIQAKNSKINFDYLEYGCARYMEYKRRKSISLSHQHSTSL